MINNLTAAPSVNTHPTPPPPSSRPAGASSGCPAANGLYSPEFEHDSCGIGIIARLDADPRHELIADAVQLLVNLEHRGAVGGDQTTGDGAGILCQIPDAFFREYSAAAGIKLPAPGDYAAGMVFLPADTAAAAVCKTHFERAAATEGTRVLGWREVPADSSCLGGLALETQPAFAQPILCRGPVAAEDFERRLYIIRRQADKLVNAVKSVDVSQFYIASLSSRTLIYKGMLTGRQLRTFFPDLENPEFKSAFAIVHQRYSTNTLPAWSLAQPFRLLAHNGEINTLRGNINRMRAREPQLVSEVFGADLEKLKPVVVEGGSDSAILDNVLELLTAAGRSLPHAMMMLVPEAWGTKYHMSEDRRSFYEYHSAFMEPWDGPAALAFTDGRYLGATLDRNGLRPARYTVSRDGVIIMASETGVLELAPEQIQSRGRLQPGRMLLVDLHEHRIVPDHEIKAKISRQRPYRHWVKENRLTLRGLLAPAEAPDEDPEQLLREQHIFGFTTEELKMVLGPMAARGQEAVGSMGNDVPLPILSKRPQLLFNYFKQMFAQVTNPPIDPLREELVMSLMSYAGRERNLLAETPEHCRMLKLHHPVLTQEDVARLRHSNKPDVRVAEITMLFPAALPGGTGLEAGLQLLFEQAETAIADGATILLLSDRAVCPERAVIPPLLAVAGLHHHLIRCGLRTAASIAVDSGEAREVIHFAMLIAFGANAVCPRVALSTVSRMAAEDYLEQTTSAESAVDNYIAAVKKGLLKTLSRMGISTIRSFLGSQIFEAVGLSSAVVDKYFTGTSSRIGGMGLTEIAAETLTRHRRGYPESGQMPQLLDSGGNYHSRATGEKHLWTADAVSNLQQAVRENDQQAYKRYAECINNQARQRMTIRSLLEFAQTAPVPLEEVEPAEKIFSRFFCSAMSMGSISREAHETIAIAMNRLGAASNSGEGGEDPARFTPDANGDSRLSKVKQIASGRFGVTTHYLINADELQIKMAQGAKPGEGGQLPGHKVNEDIASIRHTMPGVTLISPPPHHDIYSIEDLAQLIYDLKCVNRRCRISVKLVSEGGVGTIAAGVAKAQADMVLIAGHDGGTGASPLTAIKHTGAPWELGLAETQQTLRQNNLRDRIRVQTDGQLRTGRDLAVAALLGAEEFGFATVVLVTLGCVMMRKCHLNTCPVGVATQDPELRRRFLGSPEHVEHFFRFLAEDLREQMARLGCRTLDEMIGRTELLRPAPALDHWKTAGLDFSKLLHNTDHDSPRRCLIKQERKAEKYADDRIIEKLKDTLESGTPAVLDLPVRNVDRTVGARLSGLIVEKFGPRGLPPDTIQLNLKGSAGQSLGAFLVNGVSIKIEGDVNDYLGKGMSGGRVVLVPPAGATFIPEENVIAGNVVLYGATGGEVYIRGLAGERFAVRNSGAVAVVEGVGDHGCEYMTGGTVLVLGPTGNNFAAGMSGGVAYVLDETGLFDTRCNLDMVDVESVWTEEDIAQLRALLEKHIEFTDSARAKHVLAHWDTQLPYFVKVMPVEYRRSLERMRLHTHREDETVSATEEVFHG